MKQSQQHKIVPTGDMLTCPITWADLLPYRFTEPNAVCMTRGYTAVATMLHSILKLTTLFFFLKINQLLCTARSVLTNNYHLLL